MPIINAKKDSSPASAEESMKLTSLLNEYDNSTAPKAIPEDTSEEKLNLAMATAAGADQQQVQFIPSSGQTNNDAKVELGNIGGTVPQFVGLGKEELMKYANDPFWVRLRWFLFILFWIIWLGMLVGAIVIIILAPKCSGMTKGLKSVEENGPFYQIYLSKFSGDGKLDGLADKASYLKELGVKTLIISQLFETANARSHDDGISEVVNFTQVHPALGTMDAFTKITTLLQKEGIKVVLQIIPNHSSRQHPWFTDLAHHDYYVLKSKDEVEKSTWRSLYNEEVWDPVNTSDTRYLHQFRRSEADLNYRNEKVIAEMNDILKFWYEVGVDGFLFSDTSYLVENLNKLDDENATRNQDENKEVVTKLIDSSKWTIPENRSAPFALIDLDKVGVAEALKYSQGHTVPILTDLQNGVKTNFSADDLYSHFATDIGNKFVIRRLSGPRFQHLLNLYSNDRDRGYLLSLISFLVKGEVVLYNGDEINSAVLRRSQQPYQSLDVNLPVMTAIVQADDVHNFYKSLIQLHNEIKNTSAEAKDETTFYSSEGIFGFKRITSDRKVVVVANVARTTGVNLKEVFKVEAENGVVLLVTPGTSFTAKGNILNMTNVIIPPGKGVVLEEVDSSDGPLETN